MWTICNLRKQTGLGSFVLLVGLVACASGLKDTVVTEDNQAEISEQVKKELTYEEVQLLNSYGARMAPELEEGQLPLGKYVGKMIEAQRTFEEKDRAGAGDQASTPPQEQIASAIDDPVSSSADNQVAKASNPVYDHPEKQRVVFEPPPPPPPPPPTTAVVPGGTVLEVRLQESLSTKTNQAGESFEMQLEEDLIVDGKLLAPEASRVIGRLTHVKKSGKVEGLAQLGMDLQKIVVGDEEYSLKSNILSYEAEGTVKEDAKKIGIATGVGALIGAIAGGKKGAAVGTAVGAGAGTGAVLATSGEEVEFGIEQLFRFELERDVQMKVVRTE
jgi:hypothetical protein